MNTITNNNPDRVETPNCHSPAKVYTKGGVAYRITVRTKLEWLKGNKQPYFSITGQIDRKGKHGQWCEYSGGCIHEEILKHFPYLADLVAFHLRGLDGAPTHAVENGLYWLGLTQFKPWEGTTTCTPEKAAATAFNHFWPIPDESAAEDNKYAQEEVADLTKAIVERAEGILANLAESKQSDAVIGNAIAAREQLLAILPDCKLSDYVQKRIEHLITLDKGEITDPVHEAKLKEFNTARTNAYRTALSEIIGERFELNWKCEATRLVAKYSLQLPKDPR